MTTRPGLAVPFVAGVALFASTAVGQILIVDESNGPGTSFTTLTAAVAAAPDGAVLRVRAGTYTAFTLQAKGLSIVGEENAVVRIATAFNGPSIQVIGTSASQPVLIRNLLFGDSFVHAGEVLLRDALGSISLVDLRTAAGGPQTTVTGATTFRIERCANVLFEGCDVTSTTWIQALPSSRIYAEDSEIAIHRSVVRGLTGASVQQGTAAPGNQALELVRSRCWSSSSTLHGGLGGRGCFFLTCIASSGPGGTGVGISDQSTFLALRTDVQGGPGQPLIFVSPTASVPPSNGGTGIVVGTFSRAVFEGSAPRGGFSSAVGGTGAPSQVDPTGSLLVDAASEPSVARSIGTQVVGATLHFELTAPPTTLALLFASPSADLVSIDPANPGSFLVFAFPVTSALTVGPTGLYDFAWVVPPTYPLGQSAYVQYLSLHPVSQELWATNPLHVHINH